MVATRLGIVASSSPLAAQAGVQMLERGGNAIDAAVAAAAVVSVTEPASNGLGGDLFALVYMAQDAELHGLNASGWSATGASRELLATLGFSRMPGSGALSVTVPGVVAGWEALSKRFGRLPFEFLLRPAHQYAAEGFPVTEIVSRLWKAHEKELRANSGMSETFLLNGSAPREGDIFRNSELAATFEVLRSEGAAGFYRGGVAREIVRVLRDQGATMVAADLAEYEPEWVRPIGTTYRGWRVFELPPQGQGIAALMMLNIMRCFPLSEWGFQSPRALHAMIEAKKLAYADMLRYVGDPRFADVPAEELLSAEHAARRAAMISFRQANPRVRAAPIDGVTNRSGGDTIYLSAVDADGNIVSLIQSIYEEFGARVVPRGTGFVLHNRGALFTMEPGQPNTIAPRKRPLHTIIPGFMERGEVRIGFGIMGGWNQAQAHAQFISNLADHGLSIQESLEAGRFSKRTFGGNDVYVEHLIPAATRSKLARLGHRIQVPVPRSKIFGWGQAVMRDERRVSFGASEPRHDGAAIPEAPALT